MSALVSVSRLMGPARANAGGPAVIPGAFDAMQALVPAFALFSQQQLISSATYAGFAYRAQRSSDNATLDCLPNTTSLTLAAWGQAAGASQVYRIKRYDQSGAGLDSDTGTIGVAGTSPTLDCSVSVYPVAVYNGTTQRTAWTNATMRGINNTALGITMACAVQPTATPSATAQAMAISQTASGNAARTAISFLTTPNFSASTNRGDGNPFAASAPTSWDTNPNILMNVTDYPGGTVKRYVNGVAGTTTSFTSLPSPTLGVSAAVYVGGVNSQNFAPMRETTSVFYNVAISGSNLTALQAAMEASA